MVDGVLSLYVPAISISPKAFSSAGRCFHFTLILRQVWKNLPFMKKNVSVKSLKCHSVFLNAPSFTLLAPVMFHNFNDHYCPNPLPIEVYNKTLIVQESAQCLPICDTFKSFLFWQFWLLDVCSWIWKFAFVIKSKHWLMKRST